MLMGFEDLAHVRLLKPCPDAPARHPRAALATNILTPCPRRVIFANPTQSEADWAFRIYRSAKAL